MNGLGADRAEVLAIPRGADKVVDTVPARQYPGGKGGPGWRTVRRNRGLHPPPGALGYQACQVRQVAGFGPGFNQVKGGPIQPNDQHPRGQRRRV